MRSLFVLLTFCLAAHAKDNGTLSAPGKTQLREESATPKVNGEAVNKATYEKATDRGEQPSIHKKEKTTEVQEGSKPSENLTAEKAFVYATNTADGTQTLALRGQNRCITITYEQRGSEVFSCSEPLPLRYRMLDCKTGEASEAGKTSAIVTCEGKKNFHLHFRTKNDLVHAILKVVRGDSGREGKKVAYTVSAVEQESKFAEMLQSPELQNLSVGVAEEKPIQFQFSGFVTIEFERSARFGYDVGDSSTVAATNFSSNVDHPVRRTGSFFSNLNFAAKKDQTSLQSILEIGEIYSGDSSSGGAQGARAGNIIEVRNLYLEHTFSESISARAGLITAGSDPRTFIYNDHTASAHFVYNNALFNSAAWYGNAQKSRPAATSFKRDDYLSIQANLNFLSGIKNTIYFLTRNQAGATFAEAQNDGTYLILSGKATSYWVGGTFEYAGFDPFVLEATYIHNVNKFRANDRHDSDSASSYLADLKIGSSLFRSNWSLGAEGLITPGAKAAVDGNGNKVLRKRRGFQSLVGASYLMTVATNDGVDDAPGTPKQSTIANLGLDEGLRMAVGTLTWTPNKRWTLLARAGIIRSHAESVRNSSDYGWEWDAQAVHQITPSATASLDFGSFQPGRFFANRSTAELLSLKYKFTF